MYTAGSRYYKPFTWARNANGTYQLYGNPSRYERTLITSDENLKLN